MSQRIPLALSVTALVVAMLGTTPLGRAAVDQLVPRARFAQNADKVDGIHASRTPRPGYLLALNRNARLPAKIGAVGPRGPAGQQGPQGQQGAAGVQGAKGDQGAPGLSNWEIVENGGSSSSNPTRFTTVSCPGSKRPLGGGGYVGGPGYTSVALDRSWPSGPTGWRVEAHEHTNTGSNWNLNAYVICATVGS
jgi:hypothetical protein